VSRLPIRLRLTLVFAVVMALVLAALGAFLYLRLAASLDERIADELEGRAAALADAVRSGDAARVEPSVFRSEEGLAQVLGPDGESLFPSGDAVLSPDELEAARRGSLAVEHEGFRLLAEPVGDNVVVVGEVLEDRDEALGALLAQLLVALPLALLVSSVIGYLVAGAALRPVEEMRRRASEISAATAGRRLPLPPADDEVRRLGETLNEMLGRLDEGLERERRFVADASHELRTPLALLKTELEVALAKPRSAVELEDALRSAAVETDRLVRLAEDLLLISRADDGRLPILPAVIEVDAILASVARRFDRQAEASGRAIEVESSHGLVVEGDADRIGQALSNLVDNALRHGDGVVHLAAVELEGAVELHVTDDGPGFPPDLLPRAFERFSRHDEARGGTGTGLGLAIVEAIARAHGGTAHAANRAGQGADVWMALPKRLNGVHAAGGDRSNVG
jgi:heavy metal sensor kinase